MCALRHILRPCWLAGLLPVLLLVWFGHAPQTGAGTFVDREGAFGYASSSPGLYSDIGPVAGALLPVRVTALPLLYGRTPQAPETMHLARRLQADAADGASPLFSGAVGDFLRELAGSPPRYCLFRTYRV